MFPRFAVGLLLVLVATTALSGCGNTRRSLGLEQDPPNEFAVSPAVPLSVPPDFSLRPPNPGEARPQDTSTTTQAQRILLGSQASATPVSPGTAALLTKTGADRVDPGIRVQIDRETSLISQEEPSFTDRLLFWQDKPEAGVIIDPAKESDRIKANKANGQPAAAGAATPVIERNPKKAPLEGVRDSLFSIF